jgi:hypothetical protein
MEREKPATMGPAGRRGQGVDWRSVAVCAGLDLYGFVGIIMLVGIGWGACP